MPLKVHTNMNLEELAACLHEEADTRIFLQALHEVREGYKSVIADSNGTDITVIATSQMPYLKVLDMEQMWVRFGKKIVDSFRSS